jgi:hypothetical protein
MQAASQQAQVVIDNMEVISLVLGGAQPQAMQELASDTRDGRHCNRLGKNGTANPMPQSTDLGLQLADALSLSSACRACEQVKGKGEGRLRWTRGKQRACKLAR